MNLSPVACTCSKSVARQWSLETSHPQCFEGLFHHFGQMNLKLWLVGHGRMPSEVPRPTSAALSAQVLTHWQDHPQSPSARKPHNGQMPSPQQLMVGHCTSCKPIPMHASVAILLRQEASAGVRRSTWANSHMGRASPSRRPKRWSILHCWTLFKARSLSFIGSCRHASSQTNRRSHRQESWLGSSKVLLLPELFGKCQPVTSDSICFPAWPSTNLSSANLRQ